MMNTMMNCNPVSTESNPFVVCITVDEKMIKSLEKKYHEHCMALKNDMFGFGVWFTESRTIGVYGKDHMRHMAISLYYDENAEQIKEAFYEAETFDEAIEVANEIILGTIADIMDN